MAKAVKNSKSNDDGKRGARAASTGASKQPARRPRAAVRKAGAGKGKPAAKSAEKKGGFGKFMRDVRVEMGKVTWPTRKDLLQSTIVVLVAVLIAATYVGVLDFAFQPLVNVFVRH